MEKDPSGLPGMRRNPWTLKTQDGLHEFTAFRDVARDPPALVVRAGKKELQYRLRCLEDLHEMLKEHGGWILLGGAEEHEHAAPDSVEAWARSAKNPVGGWYGLTKGSRGHFATYVAPIMKVLNLAEVEENAGDGRIRAV
jgi:hypothetical protein